MLQSEAVSVLYLKSNNEPEANILPMNMYYNLCYKLLYLINTLLRAFDDMICIGTQDVNVNNFFQALHVSFLFYRKHRYRQFYTSIIVLKMHSTVHFPTANEPPTKFRPPFTKGVIAVTKEFLQKYYVLDFLSRTA